MREDVIGRANVANTPELDAYYAELSRQQGYALWTVANTIEPWHPHARWCCRRSIWSARRKPAGG